MRNWSDLGNSEYSKVMAAHVCRECRREIQGKNKTHNTGCTETEVDPPQGSLNNSTIPEIDPPPQLSFLPKFLPQVDPPPPPPPQVDPPQVDPPQVVPPQVVPPQGSGTPTPLCQCLPGGRQKTVGKGAYEFCYLLNGTDNCIMSNGEMKPSSFNWLRCATPSDKPVYNRVDCP